LAQAIEFVMNSVAVMPLESWCIMSLVAVQSTSHFRMLPA